MQNGQTTAYNQAAQEIAQAITLARAAPANVGGELPPPEKVFPPYDHTGLGVMREYGRMGNQPGTDKMQAQAD